VGEQPIRELVAQVIREAAGTVHELAAELGVTYSTLYSWATGKRRPRPAHLTQLAAAARRRVKELDALAAEFEARARVSEPGSHPSLPELAEAMEVTAKAMQEAVQATDEKAARGREAARRARAAARATRKQQRPGHDDS
jgi:transcriptional regulator with XRE-family HTH domain